MNWLGFKNIATLLFASASLAWAGYVFFFSEFEAAAVANSAPTSIKRPTHLPDKLELVKMLRERKFTALDRKLVELQSNFEADKTAFDAVSHAFDAFGRADPPLRPLLDEWVANRPNSYAARAARAMFHQHIAFTARGTAPANKTARAQFERMHRHLRLALTDFDVALERNPDLAAVYGEAMQVAITLQANRSLLARLAPILRRRPCLPAIHWTALWYLQPKWGGSFEKIDAYLEQLRKSCGKLGAIGGFGDFARGAQERDRGNPRAAIRLFSRALDHGKAASYYRNRGLAFGQLKEFEAAARDFEQAIAQSPQSAGNLDYLAYYYWRLGKQDQAESLWDRAVALDPYNPEISLTRAQFLMAKIEKDLRYYDQTLNDLNRARRFSANLAKIEEYERWARQKRANNPNAQDIHRREHYADPRDEMAKARYRAYLFNAFQCKKVAEIQSYLSHCESKKLCNRTELRMFVDELRDLRTRNGCGG